MTTTPTLWRALSQVNTTDGGQDQYNPQITPLLDGGYVVVWTDANRPDNPGGTFVMGQRYDFLGNKVGGEVKISQFASGVQLDAEATTLTNGTIAVIFHDNLSGGVLTNDIYVRVFDPALNFIRTDNIYVNGLLSSSPSITALPDGTLGLGNNQYGYSFTLFYGGNDDLFYGWAVQVKLAGLTPDQNQSEVASLPDVHMIMVYQY